MQETVPRTFQFALADNPETASISSLLDGFSIAIWIQCFIREDNIRRHFYASFASSIRSARSFRNTAASSLERSLAAAEVLSLSSLLRLSESVFLLLPSSSASCRSSSSSAAFGNRRTLLYVSPLHEIFPDRVHLKDLRSR